MGDDPNYTIEKNGFYMLNIVLIKNNFYSGRGFDPPPLPLKSRVFLSSSPRNGRLKKNL